MVKQRTPTICEWALGFTIEDYIENKERRKGGGRRNGARFKLEVSTDEESGEDSLKITYPRSDKGHSPGGKKVRFDKDSPKSALKKRSSDTETSEATEGNTTDTEANTSRRTRSSGSGSSNSSKSSSSGKKNKSKKKASDSESSDATSSGTSDSSYDSSSDDYRSKRPRHLTGAGKKKNTKQKIKALFIDPDSSSDDEEEETPKGKSSKSKRSSKGSPDAQGRIKQKKKKALRESDNDAEDDTSSDEEDTPTRTKKIKGDRSQRSDKNSGEGKTKKTKGDKGKKNTDETALNNVGPRGGKENKQISPTKQDELSTGKKKKKKSIGKLFPEAMAYPNARRPNLILPVTAQVLQVEHAIECPEDPRPNAFHDEQHGVVRVYHGPAYGNPHGALYPVRDPTRATLPVGVPHPLMNAYLNRFKTPSTSRDLSAYSQQRTSTAPGMQDKLYMATTEAENARNVAGHLEQKGGNTSSQGWAQGTYPINVSMYSYGTPGRNDHSPHKGGNRNQRSIFDMMSGSCENNAGPAMYNRAACENEKDHGSQHGSNKGGQPRKHRDLQWSPSLGQAQITNDWVAKQSNSGRGSNDNKSHGKNDQSNGWGANDGNNGNDNANDAGNDNAWANGSNGSNSNRSNKSNNSKSNQFPAGNGGSWGGEDNNVGMSSGGSNGQNGFQNSQPANAGADDYNNNAGPTQTNGDQGWSSTDNQTNGDPSATMPGAWDSQDQQGGAYGAVFVQTDPPEDNAGVAWGDASAAQDNVGGGGDKGGDTW